MGRDFTRTTARETNIWNVMEMAATVEWIQWGGLRSSPSKKTWIGKSSGKPCEDVGGGCFSPLCNNAPSKGNMLIYSEQIICTGTGKNKRPRCERAPRSPTLSTRQRRQAGAASCIFKLIFFSFFFLRSLLRPNAVITADAVILTLLTHHLGIRKGILVFQKGLRNPNDSIRPLVKSAMGFLIIHAIWFTPTLVQFPNWCSLLLELRQLTGPNYWTETVHKQGGPGLFQIKTAAKAERHPPLACYDSKWDFSHNFKKKKWNIYRSSTRRELDQIFTAFWLSTVRGAPAWFSSARRVSLPPAIQNPNSI